MGWIALIADPGMSYARADRAADRRRLRRLDDVPGRPELGRRLGPAEAVGKAAGTNSTMRELGGVFGIALSVAVFSGAGGYGSPQAFTDGFAPALGVTAGLSLVGALVGLGLPGRRSGRQVAPAGPLAGASCGTGHNLSGDGYGRCGSDRGGLPRRVRVG